MTLLFVLIVGAVIGWLGAHLVGRQEGILGSVVIGVVGAFIGSLLSRLFSDGTQSYMSFTWAGFVWTLIGAVVFAAILNSLQHGSHHHA